MMDIRDIRTNLEAVANMLDKSDGDAATRLRELSYAVGGGPHADAWAASNIHHLIEPSHIVERYNNQRRTNRVIATLEWIRNSLIFAPLVLTWLGISQAATRYGELIKADPNQISQPFIYLWQQGFGNRLSWWGTLGWLAGFDCLLLGAVLILTITVYTLSNVIKMRHDEETEDLRSKLAHALAGASLCLNTRSWSQPTNFVDRLDKVITSFDGIITQLLKQMAVLADRQKRDFEAFEAFKTQLSTIMTTVGAAVTEMKSSNETLSRTINGVIAPARDIARLQGTLTTRVDEAITSFKTQTTAHESLVKDLQKWGTALQNVLIKLEATIQIGEDMAKQTGAFTQKQTDLVTVLEKERLEQLEISSKLVSTTANLERFLKAMDRCTVELQGVNVQMEALVRRVAAMR